MTWGSSLTCVSLWVRLGVVSLRVLCWLGILRSSGSIVGQFASFYTSSEDGRGSLAYDFLISMASNSICSSTL